MAISGVSVQNFRNFKEETFKFADGITVIVGDNASGKTNILEAVSLLSTGKSFRAKVEGEMIRHDAEIARIAGKINKEKLEIVLTHGILKSGNLIEKTAKKRLLVNGVGKRLVDFAGILKTVLFRPQDMDLVTESPSIRRKFLDGVLSQVDREYRRALLSYEKGLTRRNRILLRIREEGISRSNLFFWDKLLIKNGDYITRKRTELIEFINGTKKLNDSEYKIDYDKSIISEQRLLQYKTAEVGAATTLVGPHRDDIIFLKNERALSSFGSRGEQRIGVLWVKMAELLFIKEKSGEDPTLLLDDIFSELDHEHRAQVFKIAQNQQTIITTADPHYIEFKDLEVAKIEL